MGEKNKDNSMNFMSFVGLLFIAMTGLLIFIATDRSLPFSRIDSLCLGSAAITALMSIWCIIQSTCVRFMNTKKK